MLTFSNLSHIYQQTYALQNIFLTLKKPSFTALIGPNGAGKSTFLKIIAGLLKPSHGYFEISPGLTVAYLPQQTHFDRTFPLTVKDVVAMGLWSSLGVVGELSAHYNKLLVNAIETVGLSGLENRNLNQLSGGQFQRALFARMILQDADVLLLDEPFSAIDESTTDDLLHLLTVWHQQGKTILAVMHNIDLVRHFFPQTLILARQVVAHGATDRVLNQENILKAYRLVGAF